MPTRRDRVHQDPHHQRSSPGRGHVLARLHASTGMPLVGVLVLSMVAACIRQGRGETAHPSPMPTASQADGTTLEDDAPEKRRKNDSEPPKKEGTQTDAPSTSTSSSPEAPPSSKKNDRLYFDPTYGEQPQLDQNPSPEQKRDAANYAGKVVDTLTARLERAEADGVKLERLSLPPPEQRALDYVRDVYDYIHRKHKLVVIADRVNVRRHPGDFRHAPLRTLKRRDVVYFCGGHRAPTRPDPVEVPWYWIDESGECDRSKPKEFIASREVEDGEEYWLVRWHDYPVLFDEQKRRKARKEGRKNAFLRYDGRLDGDPSDNPVIKLDPGFDFGALLKAFYECVTGVAIGSIAAPVIRRAIVKETGSASMAGVARFLGAAAGTAFTYDRSKSVTQQYGPILAGGLVAAVVPLIIPSRFVGIGAGVATCTVLKLIVVNDRVRDNEYRRPDESLRNAFVSPLPA